MRILLGLPDARAPKGADLPPGAYPWPEEGPWTRVTMLRALDGGVAGADGRSRSVSSEVDRTILGEVRRLADAIVVGATTVRLEPYGPLRAREDALPERRRRGQADAPVLVIVSGSLDLPWDEELFSGSDVTPIVVTGQAASKAALARAEEHAAVIQLDDDRVSAAALVSALRVRGLHRIVCEGGPGLLSSFAAEDQIDEVCLTVAPSQPTLNPGAGGEGPDPHSYELEQLLEHESFLFARYVRSGRTA